MENNSKDKQNDLPSMQLERESGIYPIWRDAESTLGFQIYGRDVAQGHRGFCCYIDNHELCRIEAKIDHEEMDGDVLVTTHVFSKEKLKKYFNIRKQELGYSGEKNLEFDELFPVILRAWQEIYRLRYGERHRTNFVIE